MMTTGNDDHPEWGGTSVDPVSDSNEDPGSLGARKPLAVFDMDPVLPDGLALAQELAVEHRVVYVTGRPEHTRDATTAWLGGQNLPSGRVFMRADDDFRPAREAKLRLMRRLSRFGDVAVVVDDDPAVCAALRAAGWPVRQATWMPRPESLAFAEESEGRA